MKRKPAGAEDQENKDNQAKRFDHDGKKIDELFVREDSADEIEHQNQDQQPKRDIKLRPISDNFGEDQADKEECDEGGGEVHDLRIAEWRWAFSGGGNAK
jgi:hypothetical protein